MSGLELASELRIFCLDIALIMCVKREAKTRKKERERERDDDDDGERGRMAGWVGVYGTVGRDNTVGGI
ncbi:predicted protein [Plenodomus lingam JN3]|uniref:Predicted protein n=1 Tax=Leptosphaeria maculans (strain JN3 / isolate v23.1.3 / race Av1-4-5-6-7-8) TaxID=985895 RepID=E4ZY13_LEPMJ|nr:predicted protein [Plenodomus lingam JN3]CBX96258.1 predicted protein [Plenodomus lingam JN3]